MGNKKKIWIPLVAVILVAAAIAGVTLLPARAPQPVSVYAAGMLGYEDSFYGSESYGLVASDKVQAIYVSATQTVTEIMVYLGQEVKKGDVLYTYDTTLSDLALERQDLAIQQMEINLKNAQAELKKLNAMKPMVIYESEPEKPEVDDSDKSPDMSWLNSKISGDGTARKPIVFWLSQNKQVDETLIAQLMGNKNEIYVIFRLTENDAAYVEYSSSYGVRFTREVKEITVPGATEPTEPTAPSEPEPTSGTESTQPAVAEVEYEISYAMSFFSPEEAPVQTQPDTQIDWNSGYTQAELVSMRAEKAREIKELQFNIKMEKAELGIMKKEASDGKVCAEFDGVVSFILEPQNALEMNEPMMKIAGGGGFYVEGSISELELGTIALDQTVTVNSWETGESYQGRIVEIGRYPVENQGYVYGSANVTYYPYKVFIDESANLAEGSYVGIVHQTESAVPGTFYLQNAFIITEANRSYVYVQGADGLLEKREVSAGVSTDGYMTPVYSGLTMTDLVAFPYGKDVVEGAPTQESSVDELYGY